MYTPLYYIVSAAWASVFGLTLPALRVLSLLLLAATAVSACAIARHLTGRARDGLLWLPVYLLMFDYYAWVDNANKDALHVALAIRTARHKPKLRPQRQAAAARRPAVPPPPDEPVGEPALQEAAR